MHTHTHAYMHTHVHQHTHIHQHTFTHTLTLIQVLRCVAASFAAEAPHHDMELLSTLTKTLNALLPSWAPPLPPHSPAAAAAAAASSFANTAGHTNHDPLPPRFSPAVVAAAAARLAGPLPAHSHTAAEHTNHDHLPSHSRTTDATGTAIRGPLFSHSPAASGGSADHTLSGGTVHASRDSDQGSVSQDAPQHSPSTPQTSATHPDQPVPSELDLNSDRSSHDSRVNEPSLMPSSSSNHDSSSSSSGSNSSSTMSESIGSTAELRKESQATEMPPARESMPPFTPVQEHSWRSKPLEAHMQAFWWAVSNRTRALLQGPLHTSAPTAHTLDVLLSLGKAAEGSLAWEAEGGKKGSRSRSHSGHSVSSVSHMSGSDTRAQAPVSMMAELPFVHAVRAALPVLLARAQSQQSQQWDQQQGWSEFPPPSHSHHNTQTLGTHSGQATALTKALCKYVQLRRQWGREAEGLLSAPHSLDAAHSSLHGSTAHALALIQLLLPQVGFSHAQATHAIE